MCTKYIKCLQENNVLSRPKGSDGRQRSNEEPSTEKERAAEKTVGILSNVVSYQFI